MAESPGNNKNTLLSGVYDTYVLCEASIKRYLGRFLYKPEDIIDDIAQETFLRAYRATRGREIDSPKAYLFRVAKNMALKELARKSRQLNGYLDDAIAPDMETGSPVDEELVAEQKIRLFCDAIAELPSQCRRVFLMRKYQALSHKQIAEELGISKSAVEKHIALGVERCKKYVDSKERITMKARTAGPENTTTSSGPTTTPRGT